MASPIEDFFPPRLFLRHTGPECSCGYRSEERASFEVDVSSSVVYFMNGEFPSSSMREERGTIDPEIRAADAVRATHDPIAGPVLLYVTLASAKNCVFSRRTGALRPAIGVITPRPVFTKNLPSLRATLAFPPHQHHPRNFLKKHRSSPWPSLPFRFEILSSSRNFLISNTCGNNRSQVFHIIYKTQEKLLCILVKNLYLAISILIFEGRASRGSGDFQATSARLSIRLLPVSLRRSPTSFTCLSSSPLRLDPHAIHASRFPLADRSADGPLSAPLSPSRASQSRAIAHCTIAPWGHWPLGIVAVRARRRHRARAEKRRADRPSFFARLSPPSLPPTRFIARRPRMGTGHRVAGRFFSRTDRGEGMFVRSSRQQRTTIVVQFEGGGSKLSGVKKRCVDKGKRKRGVWLFYHVIRIFRRFDIIGWCLIIEYSGQGGNVSSMLKIENDIRSKSISIPFYNRWFLFSNVATRL